MPNELKNSLNASTIHSNTKKLSKAGSSTITAMIWTISGVVLAACGSTNYITRTTEGDIGLSNIELATVTIVNNDVGHVIGVSDNRFELLGGKLVIKANSIFDADGVDGGTLNVHITSEMDGVTNILATYTLTLTDINDEPPVITSLGSGARPNENFGFADTYVLYTATGTFDKTPIVWSLKANNGDDASLFEIDSATGEVTFLAATTPDHETKDSYSFTVVATSGDLPAVELVVTINVGDVDEGDAVYVIDDSDSGAAEQIADPSGLGEGSTLYARVMTDDPDGNGTPSFQWKRNGVDILSATTAAYILTAADLGAAITVTVTYTDDSGANEDVTSGPVSIPAAPVDEGDAAFSISSDGELNTPTVGDLLTVNLDTSDPDGDGSFSYQWYVVGGSDIAGETGTSYTIANAGETIGVRVTYTDGEGHSESVEVALDVASVAPAPSGPKIINPDDYTAVTGTANPDTLDQSGASGPQLIQGGLEEDVITASAHGDVIIGGIDDDTITLGDGVDTIVYRFHSDDPELATFANSNVTGVDGRDVIHNFELNKDKLIFVDLSNNPIDFDTFFTGIGGEIRFEAKFTLFENIIKGVTIRLGASSSIEINWQEEDWLHDVFDLSVFPFGVSDEAQPFISGSLLQGSRNLDQTFLPAYFGTEGDEFVQVIGPDQLGVDIV